MFLFTSPLLLRLESWLRAQSTRLRLMDGLMAGGGDSDLFGVEAPVPEAPAASIAGKAKAKSLFDD